MPIELEYQTHQGERLHAIFLPEMGMNLISFKKGELEVIDQSTRDLFDERYAGLGALIGPHFHRRRKEILPKIKDETLFPHIARVKAKGIDDPFSHGIARYAPWKAESTTSSIKGQLSGQDLWNGVSLSSLEGQNFNMQFEAHLKEEGLFLQLSVVSETNSVIGIHYYYALPGGKGRIVSEVQNLSQQPIPPSWTLDSSHYLNFDCDQEVDFTFHPYPDPLRGNIVLETKDYDLRTQYECVCAENCWQLYHPKNASFVCIEPISAKNPRHPKLTVSALKIHLEILTNK